MIQYERVAATTILKNNGFVNVTSAFMAAQMELLELHVAAAVLEKESHGKNEWGHDAKRDPDTGEVTEWGVFSGLDEPVTRELYAAFRLEVMEHGRLSNGVGPLQITSKGLLLEMEGMGFDPWNPLHNMRYGFRKLRGYHDQAVKDRAKRPWVIAGERYNGDRDYGLDLADKIVQWEQRLAPAVI